MKILLHADVIETLLLCAIWFAAGFAAAVAVVKPEFFSRRNDG